MTYDELLPLKTLAQVTSGSGIPIHKKPLNNLFVAFCAKKWSPIKKFLLYVLWPIPMCEGNDSISSDFSCANHSL